LEELKPKFYELVDAYLSDDEYPLNQLVLVRPTGKSEDEIRRWIEDEYPEYRIENIGEDDVTIEEDPSKKKFVWPIEALGVKVQRIPRTVDQNLDTIGLYQTCMSKCRSLDGEAHDMYQAVLNCIQAKTVYEFDEKKFKKVTDAYPESMALIQSYLSKGKIKTSLRVDPIGDEK
jgi:hypothetical protein